MQPPKMALLFQILAHCVWMTHGKKGKDKLKKRHSGGSKNDDVVNWLMLCHSELKFSKKVQFYWI